MSLTTQESCRFVLIDRPQRCRFPAVNRLTDKQAIALANRLEGVDHGAEISMNAIMAIRTLRFCSPDRRVFQ